jgi:hypothetical protein
MIDRKALWISITALLAMIVAGIWRFSLLADWHHLPLDGPRSSNAVNGLALIVAPLGLLVATASMYGRKWFVSGTDDAVRPWRHWSTMFVIAYCALVGLMQAFIIARSLGYGLAMDRQAFARIFMAATGLLLMVTGNAFPKLPGLSMRLRLFQLNPWQQNRQLRFTGKLMVGLGLVLVLIGIFLPLLSPKIVPPLILGPTFAMVAAVCWHRAKLRREPSPTP